MQWSNASRSSTSLATWNAVSTTTEFLWVMSIIVLHRAFLLAALFSLIPSSCLVFSISAFTLHRININIPLSLTIQQCLICCHRHT